MTATPRQINREAYLEANAGLVLSDLEALITKARLEVAQYDAESGERAMVAETTADEILHSFRVDYRDDWSDIEHCLGVDLPSVDQLAERLVAAPPCEAAASLSTMGPLMDAFSKASGGVA